MTPRRPHASVGRGDGAHAGGPSAGAAPGRRLVAVLRGLLRVAARGAGVVAWSALALWAIGAVLTDRWLATQYLFWAGDPLLLPAAVVLSLLAAGLRRAGGMHRAGGGRRGGRRSTHPPRRRRTPSVLAVTVLAMAGVALGRWRLLGAGADAVLGGAPPAPAVRVLQWNMSSYDAVGWTGALGPPGVTPPDVALLTTYVPMETLEKAAAALGPGYGVTRPWPFAIISRFPVLDARIVPLPLRGGAGAQAWSPDFWSGKLGAGVERLYNAAASRLGASWRNFGSPEGSMVVVIRLDTTAVLGRPIEVWHLDLPSDPRLGRWSVASAAAEGLAALRAASGGGGPDLLLGDCNITRGSASLGLLARTGATASGSPGPERGMRHAFADAGLGPMATWPRVLPVFHIDHVFLAPWLRCGRYELRDAGLSDHRAQYAEVGPR